MNMHLYFVIMIVKWMDLETTDFLLLENYYKILKTFLLHIRINEQKVESYLSVPKFDEIFLILEVKEINLTFDIDKEFFLLLIDIGELIYSNSFIILW